MKMAEDRGCTLFDLSVKDLQSIHPLFGEDVTQVTCSAGASELAHKQSQGRVRHGYKCLVDSCRFVALALVCDDELGCFEHDVNQCILACMLLAGVGLQPLR